MAKSSKWGLQGNILLCGLLVLIKPRSANRVKHHIPLSPLVREKYQILARGGVVLFSAVS